MAANVEALQIVLASLYGILALTAILQIFRIMINRHNRKSFQAMFLYLAFLWMLLRTIFFSNARHYQNLSVDVLLWTPYTISFLTFSLIAVFYAKMFYADEWRTYRMYVWGSFGVVNATVAGLTIGIIIHSCTEESSWCLPNYKNYLLFTGIIGASFLLLTAVYTYFAYHLVVGSIHHVVSHNQWKLAVVSIVAWIQFLSRGIFDILKSLRIGLIHATEIGDRRAIVNEFTFVMMFLWEILPVSLILYYFRKIPSAPATSSRLHDLQRYLRCFYPRARESSAVVETLPSSYEAPPGSWQQISSQEVNQTQHIMQSPDSYCKDSPSAQKESTSVWDSYSILASGATLTITEEKKNVFEQAPP
ncbi:hypothetical protein AAMO2058_000530800 [Amorphochlora amoebiformis]